MLHEPNYEAEPIRFPIGNKTVKGWAIGEEDGKVFFRLEDGRMLFLFPEHPNDITVVEEEPKKKRGAKKE